MKLTVLILFVTSTLAENEEEFEEFGSTFDSDLQEFRWDLMRVEGTAIQILDAYFFDSYNEIMNRYYTSYEEINVEWQNECAEFPTNELDGFTKRSFNNLCYNVDRFQLRMQNLSTNYLRSIYNGGILTKSLMESNADNFLQHVVDRLEFIIPMYHYNQTCVRPKLPKLVQIYHKFVEEITFIIQTFRHMAPRSEREYQSAVDINLKVTRKFIEQIDSCKSAQNITYCLLPIVDLRDCFANSICGAEYKILQTSKKVYSAFNRNQIIHKTLINARLVKILTLNEKYADILINWENEVEECLTG